MTFDPERFRASFPIVEDTTYLVNHSLGAMPASVPDKLREFAEQWATRGVRAWGEGWWSAPVDVGNVLAKIANAPTDSIAMHPNVSTVQSVIASRARLLEEAQQGRLHGPRVPDEHVRLGGAAALRRAHRVREDGRRERRPRAAARGDRRGDADRSAVARVLQEPLPGRRARRCATRRARSARWCCSTRTSRSAPCRSTCRRWAWT